MSHISHNLRTVRSQIQHAAEQAGRQPRDVRLIAVSKTQPASAIHRAFETGQRDYGENYLQDALTKVSTLADLQLTWHFIGRIQSNKTRSIAEHFQWVHTVDREKIARRLSDARLATQPETPLNVCLQVNIDDDASKSGLAPDAVADLAAQCAELTGIRVRGLMTILAQSEDPDSSYQRMAALYQSLAPQQGWDTLSMGMSGDYAAAIHAGSTMVRVGTAIFGPRIEPIASGSDTTLERSP
ncbi:MAG: YggS family pyridoxal phosphate-dependent enzyme [Pseudomonadales bacterium]